MPETAAVSRTVVHWREGIEDLVKMVRLSYSVLHLRGNWCLVLRDVDSEVYAVTFGDVTAASYASSSRVLESSVVQRSGNWVHFPDCKLDVVCEFTEFTQEGPYGRGSALSVAR